MIEKLKSRRFILGLLGVLIVLIYGDLKGLNPEIILDTVAKISMLTIGVIGLEDALKSIKSPDELKKFLEILLKPTEEEKPKYPDR